VGERDPTLATLDGRVEAREGAAEEGLVRKVGVVGCDCECARGWYVVFCCVVWRRRNGSLGSVNEAFRLRAGSAMARDGAGCCCCCCCCCRLLRLRQRNRSD